MEWIPRKPYVIGRTAKLRPTLQHKVLKLDPARAVCGAHIDRWPWRIYSAKPMGIMTCRRCARGQFK